MVFGEYYGKLDELELLILLCVYDWLEIIMEVDRKLCGLVGLFVEVFDFDEKVICFIVIREDIFEMK